MPRPGPRPRPYECVKRAWHSDRHKPIRGSLIQEIFRVVNEIHSSATKKNKEWQDKLPIVVLKAEEIMYSKANSEVEYMDLNTLWDRANEAINTIIRLDESTETSLLLRPCIEAALILGCTPRRATRSQRNCTPSYYLNATSPEPTSCFASNPQKGTVGAHTDISHFISDYSKIVSPGNLNFTPLGFKSLTPVILDTNWMDNKSSLQPHNEPPRGECQIPYPSTKTPLVFPLYYGHERQSVNLKIGVESQSNCCEEGPPEMLLMRNISSSCAYARKESSKADIRSMGEEALGIGCDLSLRLGPCRHPPSSIKKRVLQEVNNFCSHKCLGSKQDDLDPEVDKFVSSFRRSVADYSLNSTLSNWRSEGEIWNVETTGNKRKAVVNHVYEDPKITL